MERDPSWPTVSHYAAWTVGAVCLLVLLDVAKKRRGRAFRERPADASNER